MLRAADIEKLRVDKLSISTSLLVRAAQELGLSYQLLPEKTVLISDGSRAHYFEGTNMPCTDMVASSISSQKHLSRKLMRNQEVPVPKTVALRHPAAWRKVLNSRLAFPLVVKPDIAAHGRGATMYIRHPGTLHKAVERAFLFMKKSGRGNRVLVEEYFTGHDLRLFVVDDHVVSVLHRVPAYVEGDGLHSIKDLIHAFNAEWKSSIEFDYPLCPIPFDAEIGRYLSYTRRRLSDVPKVNETVQLRWNANVSTGGRAHDITNRTNFVFKDLAVRCAKILQLPVAGIDMLVKDYERSDVTSANSVVLEANSAPGLDIHELPFAGHGQPVARLILEYVFSTRSKLVTQ